MEIEISMGGKTLSKLIVFEGIDGSGKTTLAKKLSGYYGDNAIFLSKKSIAASTDFQVKFMSEIRSILWERKPNEEISEIDEESWLYLHSLWYHMLQEFVIKFKLQQYEYVIMDGWYYKFLARHIVNNKMDTSVAEFITGRLLKPDNIFLLSILPEICLERKGYVKASECGIHKDKLNLSKQSFIDYQTDVYNAYLKILKNDNMKIIDSSGCVEDIIHQIVMEVDRK